MKIAVRIIVSALAFIAAPMYAGPTGLIVIPTADIREAGTYELEWQHDGRQGFPVNAEITSLNTQLGVKSRVEAGVDFGFSGEPETDLFFNAKYGFPIRDLPVAVGVYNVGNRIKTIGYLVTGSRLGEFTLHVGAQRTSEDYQLLFGAHRQFRRLILMADYTSGDENFASAGFEYALSDNFALQWGALFPNASDGDTGFTMHLVYNNWFGRGSQVN